MAYETGVLIRKEMFALCAICTCYAKAYYIPNVIRVMCVRYAANFVYSLVGVVLLLLLMHSTICRQTSSYGAVAVVCINGMFLAVCSRLWIVANFTFELGNSRRRTLNPERADTYFIKLRHRLVSVCHMHSTRAELSPSLLRIVVVVDVVVVCAVICCRLRTLSKVIFTSVPCIRSFETGHLGSHARRARTSSTLWLTRDPLVGCVCPFGGKPQNIFLSFECVFV